MFGRFCVNIKSGGLRIWESGGINSIQSCVPTLAKTRCRDRLHFAVTCCVLSSSPRCWWRGRSVNKYGSPKRWGLPGVTVRSELQHRLRKMEDVPRMSWAMD